tara:strand:- start:131 stop:505 length:375 start_codon:yes stop_codon:yes gene_type:complete
MAIGFIYTGTTYATPDKTMTRQSNPKVLLANFGDGYEQRVADGINSIKETYNLQFRNREKTFVDDVITFLDSKKGVTKFSFTIPDTNSGGNEKTVKVVCDNYTTNYEYDEYYTLNVNLRRVYEA